MPPPLILCADVGGASVNWPACVRGSPRAWKPPGAVWVCLTPLPPSLPPPAQAAQDGAGVGGAGQGGGGGARPQKRVLDGQPETCQEATALPDESPSPAGQSVDGNWRFKISPLYISIFRISTSGSSSLELSSFDE